MAGLGLTPQWAQGAEGDQLLAEAIAKLEYLTPETRFAGGGRGKPPPHEMTVDQHRAVGLERETWRLEVIADPQSDVRIENPLSKELGTALDWSGLMALAEKHAVRYLKVATCLNVGNVNGMGLWEGVPLREVIWLTRPTANLRRVWYHGYNSDESKPGPGFQSSLSINRVLEDPPGEQPVILAYKMNGDWLASKRGGPVRLVVPDGYGFKSIKWLQRVVLTNDPNPNDTYAGQNNDVDSPMKTFARFLQAPQKLITGKPAALTGVAQVGASGLSKVQYLRPAEGPAVARRRSVSHARRLARCSDLVAAGALGRRLARRPFAACPAPVRRQWPAADVAAAQRHRALGNGVDGADGRGPVRIVLPHDRRQRHRPAAAPPLAKVRPQRNPTSGRERRAHRVIRSVALSTSRVRRVLADGGQNVP